MKILMLKYYPVAISESFIRDQASQLTENISLYHGPYPIYYGANRNIFTRFAWGVVKAVSRFSNILYTLLCYVLIKRKRPDLVFIQYGTTAARMYRACVKLRCPFVVHFHGSDAHMHWVRKKFGKDYKKMFKHAHAIVVVSKEMKKTLIEYGAPGDKITLNPCGIDTQLFSKKTASNHFLTVGRFVAKKAPFHTITAFSKLLERYPHEQLIMIGDGPLLESSKQLVHDLKIQDSVHFLGSRQRSEVLRYMQSSFAFLQHSVTAEDGDKEGSPVAITEAAACGIPVVSTLHAGVPEIVIDGETGFLVPENDVEAMANGMIRLKELDRYEYEEMSRQARVHAQRNFDQSIQFNKLRQLLFLPNKEV